ncbi:MAG: mechanosensitive ion channel [Nitrospiraceae bacterium]|nr:mechanosensitive ion channel [Nitrospiraceae bacterium]
MTLPGQETEKKNGADRSADEIGLAELQEKRAEAGKELTAVSQPGTLGKGAPTGVPEAELLERQALLHEVVRGYDEQIDDYHRLDEARQRHKEVSHASAEWKAFAESPPYSILMTDQLWDQTFSLRLAVEGLQSQLSLIELRSERARGSLRIAEERLRQASERLEAKKAPAEAAQARWAYSLLELRKRVASVMVTAAEFSRKRVEEELAETRARLSFAQRQLETAERNVVFSEEDFNKVHSRLSQERQALERELEHTIEEQREQWHALEEAQRQLETQLARPSPKGSREKPPSRSVRLKTAVELQRAQSDTVTLKVDLLKQMLDVVEGERQLWESRFAVSRAAEPGDAREAYLRFKPLFSNFQASRDALRQQITVISNQISEQENRLNNASSSEKPQLLAILKAYRQREALYNRALDRVDLAARFLERWKSEFKEQRKELPLSARFEDWSKQAWDISKAMWNFEVFAAEDTIEVDGKKITGRRSVTVGKIISALGILIVGYWICLYLARFIGRLAATRMGMAPEVANLVRQWTQASLISLLVLVSLISVKIPLTIFAFLGGAFAIGVGFGAQTLLKNLISGILILIERPLRVGDLIEVDNIRGRVTTIGLRSSTVRDAKGIETLIPNSNFLERHLTNWTYSSQISRFSLRLGVSYDSSTHQVVELLADIAKQHPQVLKLPQPQVLLDEFGNNAFIFTLNYWLEIRLDVDPGEVASELRFMIEKSFMEAGLKVLPAG